MVEVVWYVGVHIDVSVIGLSPILLALVQLAVVGDVGGHDLIVVQYEVDRCNAGPSARPNRRMRRRWALNGTYVSSPKPTCLAVAVRCGVTPWIELRTENA